LISAVVALVFYTRAVAILGAARGAVFAALTPTVSLLLAIPLLAIAGQGIVYVLTRVFGQDPKANFFYRLLQVLTQPFIRLARLVSPRIVIDRHIPLVAFLLLAFGWLVATIAKINLCLQIGVEACK